MSRDQRELVLHAPHNDRRELNPQHADKIARMLARLDQAAEPRQLDLPGWRLHPLKGDLAGYWSITVRACCVISESRRARCCLTVMAGLGPAIHDFAVGIKGKTWMAGLRRRELQHSLSNGSSITTDRRHRYAYEEPTSSGFICSI